MKVITGQVVQEDIDKADHNDATHHCVVANALRRMFPHLSVSVGVTWATVGGTDYQVDEQSQTQISNWCRQEEPVTPFSFTLTEGR